SLRMNSAAVRPKSCCSSLRSSRVNRSLARTVSVRKPPCWMVSSTCATIPVLQMLATEGTEILGHGVHQDHQGLLSRSSPGDLGVLRGLYSVCSVANCQTYR